MKEKQKHQQPDIVTVWDKMAKNYASIEVTAPDHQAALRVILDRTGDPKGKWFCEVGCGSGIYSAYLAQLGGRVTLVDLSMKALAFAGSYFKKLGLQAQFCCQNGLQLGLRSDVFDVVWNAGVIEHFTDEGKVILMQEMWRVTRPGGMVLILVPNRWDLPYTFYKFITERRGNWPYGFADDLTLWRARELARQAGFEHVEVFAYNPVVGWWFLRRGQAITERLGLNTLVWHSKRTPFGHVICLVIRKPSQGVGDRKSCARRWLP